LVLAAASFSAFFCLKSASVSGFSTLVFFEASLAAAAASFSAFLAAKRSGALVFFDARSASFAATVRSLAAFASANLSSATTGQL